MQHSSDICAQAAGKTVQASAEPDSTADVIIYREPQFEGEPSIPTNGQDDSAQADPAEVSIFAS